MTKPRTAPYTNTWKTLQNTLYWCKLKLAQVRGLQFYQTRSHAIVLYGTLLVVCIKKAVCMKTEEELYLKVRLRLPRVVLEANSHSGQQDQRDQDARSSCDPPSSKSRTTGCKSTKKCQAVDRKVREPPAQGILLSGLEPDAEDQQVEQRIGGFDRRNEQHRNLRALRKLFRTAMHRLQYLLGNQHCLLQLWKKNDIFAETKRVRKEQQRRLFNPWLSYYGE